MVKKSTTSRSRVRATVNSTASRKIPAQFRACVGKGPRDTTRLQLLDPLVIEDAGLKALDSARRLLEHEQFLERLQTIEAQEPAMLQNVAQGVARASERANDDAKELARAALEVFNELQRARIFEQSVPHLATCFESAGKLTSDQVI